MSNDYKQCKLIRKSEEGNVELLSWIPLQFAKKSRVLKLKDDITKEWVDGWVVKKVYAIRLTEHEVTSRAEDYRHQRSVSDI